MFVIAGSASTQATSPCASARSSASRSLNSTDARGHRRVDRRAELPVARHGASPSTSVANVSSTVPW